MTVQIGARRAPKRPTLFTPAFMTLALASLAYFTSVGLLIPALPRYVVGPLGGGDAAVGLVFGSFSVTAVLLRPVAGMYGDRRGRRPLLLLGALLSAASVAGYGLVSSVAMLVVLRLASGAGEALFFVGMATMFADLAPEQRRGEAMSLASLALYVGLGLGAVVGELALAITGFSGIWLLAALSALIAMALAVKVIETGGITAARPQDSPGLRFVHPAGLLPGVLLFAGITGMAGFLTFVPLHVLDVGLADASFVLVVFAGVVVLIRSVGARLPDVFGPSTSIRVALLASATGLLVMGTWLTPVGVVAGTAMLAIGVALLTPSVLAGAVSRVAPHERGQVMATTSAFVDVAFGVGPLLLGLVAASLGRPAAFFASGIVALAGLALVTKARLGGGQDHRRPVTA
jgi:predicted MFS family arabinose efflux permease